MADTTGTASGVGDATTAASEPGRHAGPTVDDPAAVQAGDCIGRYTVRAQLGAGAMGEVFAAHDPELDRVVALKILRPELAGRSPLARARFQREAQALGRLNHPNVVSVYDVGVVGERVFVAMELVEGPTLAKWIADGPHRWREVAAVFLEAGRGLAAVHDAGLVHRDFKPSNVMLGDRTRVVDFGLARPAGLDDDQPGSPSSTILDATITSTGQALGTPAYMAPEQRRGEQASPRSDQYSFAVALHEALLGARPRDPTPPGPPREVPVRARALLDRALREAAEERYPSMHELLDDLAHDPARARRRYVIAGGGAGAIAIAAVAAWNLSKTEPPEPCPPPDDAAIAMWGPDRKAAVRARVATIDPVQGKARFDAADRVVAPFVARWREMHVESCRETRVRAEQSDTLFDLRLRCLQRRADELDFSVAAVMAAADGATLDAAITGLVQLTPIAGCGDVAALARIDDRPIEPAARATADHLAKEIQAIEVDVRAGQLAELAARADKVVAQARALGHAPTLATALAALSRVQFGVQESQAAVTTLRELIQVAARAHQDREEAYSWTRLIGVIAYERGKPDEALGLVPAASAAVLRAGDPPDLRAELLYNEAMVLEGGPRFHEALERLVQARRLLERAGAERAGSPLAGQLATVLLETGNAQSTAGDLDASITTLQQAIDRWREMYGPDSVDEGIALHDLSESLRLAGRLNDALVALRHAARINEARSRESLPLAGNLVSIATVLGDQGAWPEALASYDRALRIYRARLAPDDVQLSAALVGRANALGRVGRVEDARSEYPAVIGLLERAGASTLNLPIAYFNRGELAARLGRCDEALVDFARAADGFTAQEGATTSSLVYPLMGQGRCLVQMRRASDAVAPLTRAAALRTLGNDALHAALAQVWLGRALAESGRDRARGIAMARAARPELATVAKGNADGNAELRDLDRWLAAQSR